MPYRKELWEQKIARRSDLSSQLVHLTRTVQTDDRSVSAIDVLTKILLERRISPSSTASGFIVGKVPATCFQDAPLYAIAQNIYAEEEYRKEVSDAGVRYVGVGLMFNKITVYQRGGRPVIYENTQRAKEMLRKDEWWRIVRLDLANEDDMVDWTHEREWRVPGAFDFELGDATVLLPNKQGYDDFICNCETHKAGVDIIHDIRGIVNLGSVFY